MDVVGTYIQNIHYFIEFILSVHEHRGWYEELTSNIPQLFFFLNPVFALFFYCGGKVLNMFYTAECIKSMISERVEK